VIGLVPFLFLIGLYNQFAFGNPLLSGYSRSGLQAGAFALRNFLPNFLRYFLYLNLTYPMMLVSILFYRGRIHSEILACTGVLLIFYSFYFWFDNGANFFESAVRSLRFLLPVVPLMLIAYADLLTRIFSSRFQISAAYLALAALSSAAFLIHYKHDLYLQREKTFSDFVYKITPENSVIVAGADVRELMQTVWGKRKILEYNPERITQSLHSGENSIYFISNNKPERPEFREWDSNFLSDLERRFAVNAIRQVQNGEWKMSVYKITAGNK
jgi:hypothetical protein